MSIVVVTGCSSGIGLETAIAFAHRGDTTVATMRDVGKADTLLDRAATEKLTIHLEQLDVCNGDSVDRSIAGIISGHGTIDVLVNNAGVLGRGPVETMSIDNAMRVMNTNYWGPMRTTRAVLPAMREQRSGVIINVSSVASRLPVSPYGSMYAASKRALNALSEALAGEVAPFGIRVVSIEPGFFKTEISTNYSAVDESMSDAYAADQQWVRSFVEAGVDAGADPAVVADAIVAASFDPATPLHVPVGDDAALYLELLDEVDSYEGWIEGLIPHVEAMVGPRPDPLSNDLP